MKDPAGSVRGYFAPGDTIYPKNTVGKKYFAARVAYISGLKPLSFTLTGCSYNPTGDIFSRNLQE